MPERTRKRRDPKYRLHKATGQAFIELNRRRFYLGEHGSPESWTKYHEMLEQWHANGSALPPSDSDRRDMTVAELLLAFKAFAETYYRKPDGTPTSEVHNYAGVSRVLREVHGSTRVRDFGPAELKTVRQSMIQRGWVRRSINQNVCRIRRIFRWAVAEGMIDVTVHQALCAVDGLRRGRCDAAESEAVLPVPDDHIDAIRPHVSRQVWALVQLQRLSGARGGELMAMRPVDIDTSGDVWSYRPSTHKTEHHGRGRVIYFGRRAQEVLKAFLSRPVDAFMFSPAEAEAERREQRHTERKTPLSCGNKPGSRSCRNPKRPPGEKYDSTSYRRAVQRGCDRAGVPRWHPHRLRHNCASELRSRYTLDVVQVLLGHSKADITQTYALADQRKAIAAIRDVG